MSLSLGLKDLSGTVTRVKKKRRMSRLITGVPRSKEIACDFARGCIPRESIHGSEVQRRPLVLTRSIRVRAFTMPSISHAMVTLIRPYSFHSKWYEQNFIMPQYMA